MFFEVVKFVKLKAWGEDLMGISGTRIIDRHLTKRATPGEHHVSRLPIPRSKPWESYVQL